ncbi:MAG: DUF3276 family protein [Saprospiraceae bacterium]|nr:DUF3276 family protein [Saprospiraceae bacterium]
MDNKNVIHTEQVSTNNKTFFFDLKESKSGGNYLKITQSRIVDEDQRERTSMILFERDLPKFGNALFNSLMAFQGRTEEDREAFRTAIQSKHPNAFTPWSKEDEEQLAHLFEAGYDVEDLSQKLQRNVGGIKARIKKMGLIGEITAEA